ATASTDTTAPTATITSPAAGANVANGKPVTITGTAADTGGQVGGVEGSTAGGLTWHPPVGRAPWSYAWLPTAVGSASLRARAVDDSANLGAAAQRTVNVIAPTLTTIQVTPSNPTVTVGGTQQFTATGLYSDQSTQDLTTQVTWTSSNTAVS